MRHSIHNSLVKNLKKLLIPTLFFLGISSFGFAGLQQTPDETFTYTEADQTYTVPECVTKIKVHMWGAGGGGGDESRGSQTHGGGGGYVSGNLSVTSGEDLSIIVGEGGKFGLSGHNNSYGGGGKSGTDEAFTGSGGGRSAIRRGTTELATAGAGGGGGETRNYTGGDYLHGGVGGAGGGLTANGGSGGEGNLTATGTRGGGGGTQSAGGQGGQNGGGNGENGSQFKGGDGSTNKYREGGGGGSGYYGGGGGAGRGFANVNGASGGGGGSSYIGGLLNTPAPLNLIGGSGQLPNNSQQKAANDISTYNNQQYGRGGNVASDGQNGLVVIEIVETAVPTATLTTSNITTCHGSTVTLSGTVSTIDAWTLNLSDGSSVTGTGNQNWSIDVIPTATTTYSLTSLTSVRLGSCPTTLASPVEITLPTAGTSLAADGESATCLVKGNNYIHFYHSSGKLIGSINPNGEDLGEVTMTMFNDGTSQTIPACGTSDLGWATSVMNRHWLVDPENEPITNNIDVRLPFSDDDYTDFKDTVNSNANPVDNISNIDEIKLSKYNGTNENGDAIDNCGNGVTIVYNQTSNGVVTTNNYPTTIGSANYIQYNVPSFSELWLQGNTDSPLPIELTNFSAECGEDIVINWTTASETNSDEFIIEKSRDGKIWTIIDIQKAAGNSTSEINYSLIDENTWNGLSYYRLRQIDFDGKEEVYGPISVSCANENTSIIVFPNPINGKFTVEVHSQEEVNDATIQLFDMMGRVIATQKLNITKGINQAYFEQHDLKEGVYMVGVIGLKEKVAPVKVVKR